VKVVTSLAKTFPRFASEGLSTGPDDMARCLLGLQGLNKSKVFGNAQVATERVIIVRRDNMIEGDIRMGLLCAGIMCV